MNKRVLFAAVLVLILLVAVVVPVSAKAVKTDFSGVSTPAGPPIELPVCSAPDGNQHCRGMVLVAINDMSDTRLSGTETVTIHWNFRSAPPPVFLTGRWWGTSQIVNDGGYWDATFTGERDEQGFGHLRVVAHGHGGYEGLKAFYTGLRSSADEAVPFVFSGHILEPGS